MGVRSGDWLGHSRTFICFFLSHSFVVLVVCFGSLSYWKIPPQPIFSALTEGRRLSPKNMAPFILPSIRWSCPVPLAEKHPQSEGFHLHASQWGWCSWCCTQHFSSFKHSKSSWCQIALFWSHLTTSPSPKPPPDHPGVLWQTSDRPVHVPSSAEEPCACSRILILRGVVCDCGPNCLQVINKLLLCSTGLIPDLSHHHWYPTRQDLAWSPRPREIGGDSVFLPFSNNCSNSC